MRPQALIVGAGAGLSASLARLLAAEGYALALAARNVEKLAALSAETGASLHACDASDPAAVAALFAAIPAPEVAIYNASLRLRGPVVSLDPAEVRRALEITAFGAFLMAREAAARMEAAGCGTILFTGASASVKGFPGSAPFAMGKFALRGLAESLARELHPKGVHVAHIVVDGAIRGAGRPDPGDDSTLCPDAVAAEYLRLIRQPRSAWSHEITLRPWVERF
ncbi:MAG: SDR family NAD(P)-dependent oxidoreductase [Acetobacteraceae bacterium]|nr:SDR family NAD(P)-dependent oxidoreductase [Acetobacteraceae bacterium]MDW8398412.1 SDR family NAD(P)-dependent oxidoreductase [Acetobacteraceae bacterium]